MLVWVYRNNGADCSNGGVSAKSTRLHVVNIGPPSSTLPHDPPVLLLPGNLPGTVKIVPVGRMGEWSMFGGNYAATCDSRFTRAVEKITGAPFYGAVPIHDRYE